MMYTLWLTACTEPVVRPGDRAPTDVSTTPDDPTTPPSTPGASPPPETTPEVTTHTASECFAGQWGAVPPVDYDQFGPVLNATCTGTDHQDIRDVERVVFVGDSITVGTPPTATDRWWRNQVTDELVDKLGLTPPNQAWRFVDLLEGAPIVNFSGDFANCAQYGARTDDLLDDPHRQLETCMPEQDRGLRTLVVFTIGGNDIFSLLEDARAGVDPAVMEATYALALDQLREAVRWVVEPGRFPNGVFVVFGNTYDFTDPDGARDMARCPGADLLGLDSALAQPAVQDILARAQEQYVSLAVETGTDLMFVGEAFCGHGHDADNPGSRCYRGPDADLWFDFTCEHPSTGGHDALASMVLDVLRQ